MDQLTVRPAEDCRYDIVSLGEVMLRLDPGEGRIRKATAQAPCHIVFTATFPGPELPCCADASFSRIEAQHHLT